MALEGISGPIDVAISGMRAQNRSISAIYSNVANARTTDAGNGQPYRRVEAVLRAQEGTEEGIAGVEVAEMAQDARPFQEVLDPGHPSADANGYVRMPNVDLASEMIDLTMATRAYQANAAVLKRYQGIVDTALELLR